MARSFRSIATIVAASIAAVALVGLFAVQAYSIGRSTDLLPSPQAPTLTAGTANAGPVTVEYCSETVAARNPSNPTGRTSTTVELDDTWFSGSSENYHHGIATSCAVLSAVCNSESHFYGGADDRVPYAERALSALGFQQIRTDSYALRSAVLDQIAALVNGSHDVAAYTFASKQLVSNSTMSAEGTAPETLIFVGVRGSYGVEWISNFNLFDTASENVDHRGFKTAEQEIAEALERYTTEIGADPNHTRIVITGHSRGGSIANLLAADLASREDGLGSLAHADRIYAYTFAAPCSTRSNEGDSEAYAGIYNIVNPSDLVPQMPFAAWGYSRYGTTVELPGFTSARFSSSLALMQQTYQANTGLLDSYNPDALERLDSFDAQATQSLPTFESLLNPLGIFTAARELLGVDLELAITSHYPDTYIAWMQTVDARALSFARPA